MAHRRCAVGDPVDLVLFITLLPGQHQHRDRGNTLFDPVPVKAHKLPVALCGPAMVRGRSALPVILQCPLTVFRSEVLPAGLLGDEWIKSLSDKQAVVHQLRSFVASVRGQVTLQLAELDAGQAQPAAVPEQDRQCPRPRALSADFIQDLAETEVLGVCQSGKGCNGVRIPAKTSSVENTAVRPVQVDVHAGEDEDDLK